MLRFALLLVVSCFATFSAQSACYVLHPINSCLRANLGPLPCTICGPVNGIMWECCYDITLNTTTANFARECREPTDPTTYMDAVSWSVVVPGGCSYRPGVGCNPPPPPNPQPHVCTWGAATPINSLTDVFSKTAVTCTTMPPC